MRGGSGGNAVDSFAYPVQSGSSSDSQIGPGHIVIDTSDQANNVQNLVVIVVFLRDLS